MNFKEHLKLHARRMDKETALLTDSFDYVKLFEETKGRSLRFSNELPMELYSYGSDYVMSLLCCQPSPVRHLHVTEKTPMVMYYLGVFGSYSCRIEIHRHRNLYPELRTNFIYIKELLGETDRAKQLKLVCDGNGCVDASEFEIFDPLSLHTTQVA